MKTRYPNIRPNKPKLIRGCSHLQIKLMEVTEEEEQALLQEVQNRKYVSEDTMKKFYRLLEVRKNEHSILLDHFDILLNQYQEQIELKKSTKQKLKDMQHAYSLAYNKLYIHKEQKDILTDNYQSQEDMVKKETLFKEIDALKEKIKQRKRQYESEKAKYDLILKHEQEKYNSIIQQIELLEKEIEFHNDAQQIDKSNNENQIKKKQVVKTCDLFPLKDLNQPPKFMFN